MKKLLPILLALLLALPGCGAAGDPPSELDSTTELLYSTVTEAEVFHAYGGQSETLTVTGEDPEDLWDLIPMVMVDGQLYYDTGRRNNDVGRCGVMDGEITSSVEGWETPTEDNQSNFGSGYGWQWGSTEGEIEVNIEDNWLVFEARPGDGSTTTAEPEDTTADEAIS